MSIKNRLINSNFGIRHEIDLLITFQIMIIKVNIATGQGLFLYNDNAHTKLRC